MGVQLDESDLSELEPQIFKIFKKQLGFFDGEILSNMMGAIHEGVDRAGLEQRLANTVEKKKAQKLIDEVTEVYCHHSSLSTSNFAICQVWAIVNEYYLMKEESWGGAGQTRREAGPRRKRRFEDQGETEDSRGDTWSKAERYKKEELDKVQQIPAKKPKTEGDDVPAVAAPSADQIKKMMANTQKMIEERKKQLNLTAAPAGPPQPSALSHKATFVYLNHKRLVVGRYYKTLVS